MIKSDMEIYGGITEVSRLLGVTPARVIQMFYPKEKGGNDGNIPYKHAKVLYAESLRKGYGFTLGYILGEE